MKVALYACVIVMTALAYDSDGTADLNSDRLILGSNGMLRVKKHSPNGCWHSVDTNNEDLLFDSKHGLCSGDHQYFTLKCKKQCQSSDVLSFFLTENKPTPTAFDEPAKVYAYLVEVS